MVATTVGKKQRAFRKPAPRPPTQKNFLKGLGPYRLFLPLPPPPPSARTKRTRIIQGRRIDPVQIFQQSLPAFPTSAGEICPYLEVRSFINRNDSSRQNSTRNAHATTIHTRRLVDENWELGMGNWRPTDLALVAMAKAFRVVVDGDGGSTFGKRTYESAP